MVEVLLCKSASATVSKIKLLKALGMTPHLVTKVREGFAIDYYTGSLTSKGISNRVSDAGLGENPLGERDSFFENTTKGPQHEEKLNRLSRLYNLRSVLKSRMWSNDAGEGTDLLTIIEEMIGLYEEIMELAGEDVLNTGGGMTQKPFAPRKAPAQVEN